ncbi:UDP-N-acetylmuramate dehydrogenase [Candidatus Gracilibacteria bacterium]|nr:UDP-N-acetylmuramate dehydrogenase [Candidatus Gracilibacteria bacterium]
MLEYLQKDKKITDLSNFKTKAFTRYYFEIHNRQDIDKLFEIYNFSKNNNLKILFIGGGTNLLFAFEKFNGIIIKNCLVGWQYDFKTKILKSYSNELISDIAYNLEKKFKQDLWHRFIGLPGSIGGAVFGNAGCFGLEIENNFNKAEVLDLETGKIQFFDKSQMKFSYRNSIIKELNKYFIINVEFDLSKKIEKYSSNIDNIDFRENKQPKGNSCGSFFKNPSKDISAGSLIEKVGYKGKKIGGAYFSDLHANFLMTENNTNYKDLLTLIKKVKENVKNKYNIELINEVRIIRN